MMNQQLLLLKILELLFFSISIILFTTCNKEVIELKSYDNVEEPLHKYFQQFEIEAAKRDLFIDLNKEGIIGRFSTLQHNYFGLCSNTATKEIIIDERFWGISSNLLRELIIFHELGHCVLERPHNNDIMPNGTCASIMRSGNQNCIDFYNTKNRERMLDELFRK